MKLAIRRRDAKAALAQLLLPVSNPFQSSTFRGHSA